MTCFKYKENIDIFITFAVTLSNVTKCFLVYTNFSNPARFLTFTHNKMTNKLNINEKRVQVN